MKDTKKPIAGLQWGLAELIREAETLQGQMRSVRLLMTIGVLLTLIGLLMGSG